MAVKEEAPRARDHRIAGRGAAQAGRCLSKPVLLLAAMVAIGFCYRLIGLRFGLPELYHADEPIVVHHALAYGAGDLNPHFFQIPPLISYLLFFAYGAYFLAGWLIGKFSSAGAFADLFLTDPTNLYVLGRFLLGVLPGTAAILAIYFLAKRVATQKAGLWAAVLLSVCFLPVRDSHYIYTDIPLSLALVVGMITMLRLFERGAIRDYAWAGVMVGLCTAIKYNAALIGCAYLAAHLLRAMPLRIKLLSGRFWVGVAACFGLFILANPFSVLDFWFFRTSFARQGAAQGFVGWSHHLSYSLVGGMGGIAVAAALAGMGLSVYLNNRKAWIVLAFVLPFYGAITLFGQPHDRYVLPLIPFACLFVGLFADWAMQRMEPRLKAGVLLGLVVFLILPMAIKSAYSDWLFLQPDSRTQAKRWIESHVSAGAKIALDHTFYVPKLLPTKEQLLQKWESAKTKETGADQKQRKLQRLLALVRPGEARYNLYFISDRMGDSKGFLFAEPRIAYDFDALRKEGIKVVVTHRLGAWKSHFAFFAQVEQHSTNAYRFSPYRAAWRDFSREPLVRTGGAFLWSEMLDRRSNGEYVTVYLLE